MQAHRRLIAVGLFLASFICLLFIKLNSCSSYMESWLGFTPVYVVETAVVVGGAYFFMPENPHSEDPVLTVWLRCNPLLPCHHCVITVSLLPWIYVTAVPFAVVWLRCGCIIACACAPVYRLVCKLWALTVQEQPA